MYKKEIDWKAEEKDSKRKRYMKEREIYSKNRKKERVKRSRYRTIYS